MTIECEVCIREFVNWHAARQHMNAVGHWGCDTCEGEFGNEDDAIRHMDSWSHHKRPEYECEACNDEFFTFADARSHMDSYNHWRKHYCHDCERGFQNENNLRMHLNSRIHRGQDITCPFCKRSFTTTTGVAHHLESGACPKAQGLNRDSILREIRKRDPNHVITKKLLTYPTATNTTIEATHASYNGHQFECYLCHREFVSLHGLNQHLNSPAHREAVYHCPGRMCGREFKALAPLFNHLESETCGAVRFEAVQRNVGNFVSGGRMIQFR